MDDFEEEFEKKKLHPKVYFLYEHFFKFFDIRKFVSNDFKKRMLFYWNKYFRRRDDLEDLITEKDVLLNDFSVDNILYQIDSITDSLQQFNSNLENLLSEIDTSITSAENKMNSFEEMLEKVSF